MLQGLVTSHQWTNSNSLLDLQATLPESLPLVCAEVLRLVEMEGYNGLGWRMQVAVAEVLANHEDRIITDTFGTVLRGSGFSVDSSVTHHLLRGARRCLKSQAAFEDWFKQASGRGWLPYADKRQEAGWDGL